MAAEDREHKFEIIEKLIAKSSSFSFAQAVRLLLHHVSLNRKNDFSRNDFLDNQIRIRPELSLRFPGTDITQIEKIGDEPIQYLITATFLGLYGTSSPLPTFYTEDLIEEFNNDKSIKRDFIDILNYSIYPIFFKIWSKYRLFYKICEENDETVINMIYCLLGLENKQLREQIYNTEKYFRYAGLTIQFPRSAEGLISIIEDCFNLKNQIKINQCVLRKVSIPDDQHSLLGISSCTLGQDSVIGYVINDITGKFQMVIKDANADILHLFLPDQQLFLELKQMVDFYVNQPLEWELVIELEGKNIQTAQPGNKKWSNLGWNTWLVSENNMLDKVEPIFSAI
ncbi:MAG: type VI secretion system baseplate subunit TssG [Deltaproteobacteria bacterium]|uniref:type VI secretion system baseplate subunit TssG n=1 Tax=Desulfobacula sp. TaxID=2593537 RepID=UPI0019916DA0|nr:type VI secretion system baseplate subunit TssG [Candidatus Desulfobacula maris]MBL6993051.1 type VI secretion system baseplate subunit TssG [Desulfobacula sp.]